MVKIPYSPFRSKRFIQQLFPRPCSNPPSGDKRNITVTLDVLHEFCSRPTSGDYTIGGFITWLRECQKCVLGGPDKEKNPAELSKLYVDVLSALQNSGADLPIARFVFNNTGVTFTTCERLVEMRNNGIDEPILWSLLKSTWEGGA